LLCGRPVAKVQHAAYALPPANHTLAIGSLQGLNELVPDALMIPLRVIVRQELRHGAPKVALAKEQYAVQALLVDRSHEPLCVGMTVRRTHWRPDDPDALPFKEPHHRTAPLGGRDRRSARGRAQALFNAIGEGPHGLDDKRLVRMTRRADHPDTSRL
jgi:hypothetical protein